MKQQWKKDFRPLKEKVLDVKKSTHLVEIRKWQSVCIQKDEMEKTGTERDWLSPKIPSTVRKRNGVKAKKKQKERKGWKYNIQKEMTEKTDYFFLGVKKDLSKKWFKKISSYWARWVSRLNSEHN